MIRRSTFHAFSFAALLLAGLGAYQPAIAASDAVRLPVPVVDSSRSSGQGDQVAVFAGGCFWGVESVFEHVKGVRKVVAGYSGGSAGTAHYNQVSDGNTGHAESVRVQFDPARVSYGQLLQVLFSVAMDPTQLNRQGPDRGTQYRSAIFYGSPEQKRIALAYVAQLTAARSFPAPIVTQVVPLSAFYPAEAYHQDYARRHPNNPYIVYNDAPKVRHLKQLFPALYRAEQEVVDVQLH
ncbi:MAG: peptide-methionine (S)-S-oxide reductase MsrA [Rhodanobacter sp.]|jgi:peptide-methionine (S)-S-oxide reductase|nr:peptide-methionine (S)-S-oxide reductase MsrA [Rhodanobacter sp.]